MNTDPLMDIARGLQLARERGLPVYIVSATRICDKWDVHLFLGVGDHMDALHDAQQIERAASDPLKQLVIDNLHFFYQEH